MDEARHESRRKQHTHSSPFPIPLSSIIPSSSAKMPLRTFFFLVHSLNALSTSSFSCVPTGLMLPLLSTLSLSSISLFPLSKDCTSSLKSSVVGAARILASEVCLLFSAAFKGGKDSLATVMASSRAFNSSGVAESSGFYGGLPVSLL